MDWIHRFQLFLFDFDGLLVDTERLHYRAYKRMLATRGYELNWSFSRYCAAAHLEATALRDQIYTEFPSLQALEPHWEVLYAEKRKAFMQLLEEEPVDLMAGAIELLNRLEAAGIDRCVVTHSPLPLIERVRRHQPVLNSIPVWITREDYSKPKPDPECYRKAIHHFSAENLAVIGFEDSFRGLQALLGTAALPILVCPADAPFLDHPLPKQVLSYRSLVELDTAPPR